MSVFACMCSDGSGRIPQSCRLLLHLLFCSSEAQEGSRLTMTQEQRRNGGSMSSSSALDGNTVKMINHLCSTDNSALLKGTEGMPQAKQNRKEKELKD